MASPTTTSSPADDAGVAPPRASFSHASRFLEGSMNDRVSAVPPPVFLGPEDAAAYERQFYVEKRASVQSDATSSKKSSSSSSAAGFFAPLLERLHITRSKTSGSGAMDKNAAAAAAADFRAVEYKDVRRDLPLPAQRPDGGRPTREDMLASYQDLMKSGFFNAHAIQSTRHAPPPPPSLRSHQQQHAAFTPMPTIYAVPSEQPTDDHPPPPPPPTTTHLLPRGTKRPLDPETPARKLVKKLRKSTSRLGGGAADRLLPSSSSSSTTSSLFTKHHHRVPGPSQSHALDRRLSKSPQRRRHPPPSPRRRHRRTPSPNKLERAAAAVAAARANPVVSPPPLPSSPGKHAARDLHHLPAVPSFHYPQRTRHPRAAPDDVNPLALHPLRLSPSRANRAAPPQPPVPEPFKFAGATSVVGVREEDVENHQAPMSRAWKGIQWR